MNRSKNTKRITALVVFALLSVLLSLIITQAAEERIKFSDMEKEDVDGESNKILKEYYGDLIGFVGNNAKFNSISKKDSIAVLNITVDGKDRRILTRLYTGALFPNSALNITNYGMLTATNIVALGNISFKGFMYNEKETSFGTRRLYSEVSSAPRYIDEGRARLHNGKASITINPILKELINSYAVFISPEGITKGIYVAEKTKSYFVVRSANPSSNIAFSWMIRGMPADFADEYLNSYSKGNISITAKINYGNQTTEITIYGLKNIASSLFENNNSSNSNLITANAVLEEDLSQILGDMPQQLPQLEESTPTINETVPTIEQDAALQNPANDLNETVNDAGIATTDTTPKNIVVSLTLNSIDESVIIENSALASNLSISEVKKAIKFTYASPEDYSDEVIEDYKPAAVEGIQKVNGSVIIKLG